MAIQLLDGGKPSPLANLIADYLMHCEARGLAPKTLSGYGYALERIFLPWCEAEGITDIADLDRRAFDRFTSLLLKRASANGRPLSRHTASHYIRPVRLLMNWADREGENVRSKPQLPRCEDVPRDVLTRSEIQQLEDAKSAEREKLIVRIFADCGLRLDELTKLTPNAILRTGRQGFLRVLGKRGRTRDVPVPPQLLRRIERHIESRPEERSSDRIFLTLRRGAMGEYLALSQHGVEEVIGDAAKRAHMQKRVYPHLLRHSWMTEMVRSGMHPFQLSVIAGASPQVIAKHYTHLTRDDAYAAMLLGLAHAGSRRVG
jgi:site-specific recombinase XerD